LCYSSAKSKTNAELVEKLELLRKGVEDLANSLEGRHIGVSDGKTIKRLGKA